MEMNPQRVRSAEFKTVRKGADPDEVRVFLGDVADELERAQNQSTAMEARARAAVARLQELSDGGPPVHEAPVETPAFEASVDEADTISRTLLLAQRTADTAVAEARVEASRILQVANDESSATLDSTREMSALLLAEAREEARGVGEAERIAIAGEVDSLMARRDFLESDVDHLETFLVDQRARVRDAATSLMEVAERVPGGLGESRRPLLSASDDEVAEQSESPQDAEQADELEPIAEQDVAVEAEDPPQGVAEEAQIASDPTLDNDIARMVAKVAESEEMSDGAQSFQQTPDGDGPDDDEFRFSFETERN